VPLLIPQAYRTSFTWLQLVVVYVLLEGALWSSRLSVRNRWALAAAIMVVGFVLLDLALSGRPSLRQMGLGLPTAVGATFVLAVSFAAVAFLIYSVRWMGGEIPANATWPNLHQSWGYLVWALIQEFLLQSFFFTRFEKLFTSSAAVWVAATLFAAAHLPSPILTTLTLLAALFFCEMFRRYRSIYPIALVHAVLGLTISATMPNSVLHHMRVGIGYLR
jgi:membrane protease YdiL (CAAX protease family)